MKTAKDRLSPLDQLETPDVWARAKSLEPGLSSDPESPATPRSGRLVAAVVAFAVFIAAGVFAWRSLQPAPGTPTGEGSTFAATLWPEQSAEELAATQAQIDAGNPDYSWRLDPTQVASAFAESVLGWGPPTSDSGGTNYAVTLDSKATESENSVFVSISQPALPCPSPPPGQAGTCPPPYASELLALQRSKSPEGSGVWTVTEARASGFELNVAAGDRLTNGDPISGSLSFPSTAAATTDYVTQYGFFVNGGDACDGGNTYGVETIQNQAISFPASIGLDSWTANHCAPEPSGLAFVASGSVQPCPKNVIGCPFVALVGSDLGANHQPLYGLTAIPISVSVPPSPARDSSTTPSSSESNVSPAPLTGEIDSLGLTFQYPSTWHLQPFDEEVGLVGFTGAVISNVDEDLHHPDQGANSYTTAWDLSALPPTGVVVSIERVDGMFSTRLPDSEFPVSLADAQHIGDTRHAGDTEGLWLEFTLNGRAMGARVYFGPAASEEDRRIAADVVASIRSVNGTSDGSQPMDVYEALIRKLADPAGTRPIYVRSDLCFELMGPEPTCPDRLSEGEQLDLGVRLHDLGNVVFVRRGMPDPSLQEPYQEIVLSPIVGKPDGLRVEGGTVCGGMCGGGAVYVLEATADGYAVIGTDDTFGEVDRIGQGIRTVGAEADQGRGMLRSAFACL